jgi:hypothetical protein
MRAGAQVIRIESKYFVAGAFIENGHVKAADPIIGYMEGWSVGRVANYCMRKHWRLEVYP